MIPRKRIACVLAAALAVLLASCSEKGIEKRAGHAPASAPAEQPARLAAQGMPAPAPRAASSRYVAVRNFVAIEVDAAQVEAVLKLARDRCVAPDCEILESSITRESRDAPPQARIRLRIVPGASEGFVDELARQGDLIERRAESEDKTDQVVDVEARIRNMTELRDRLRKLLSAPHASVKDLAEVEAQLARVQADLDSATGRRQALAQETEKVAIAIDIRPRRAIAEAGAFAPVGQALTAIGHTFAESLAVLIAFTVAVVPWLAVLAATIWAWRRWRRARRSQHPKEG